MKFKDIESEILGNVLSIGEIAPNFEAIDRNFKFRSLTDFKKKYVVINVVPSLDTSVCSFQTRKFNMELNSKTDVDVITISNDLPFAQARWCAAEGLENIEILSDYINIDFALKYGVLIKEVRLLARSVFVLDENRKIIYLEYVKEQSMHPDYDKVLELFK